MHPDLEHRMLTEHLAELRRLAGPHRHRHQLPDGSRAPRNRPRVRAGLVLMRMGARLAKPALRAPAPFTPDVLMGHR